VGAVYRETYTKPLPDEAELFTRKGERFARWRTGRGKRRTAPVVTGESGGQRVQLEAGTYTAKYRNGAGHVVKVATGCRSLDAARAVLVELESRAEKVHCGKWTAAEDAVLDHQATLIAGHVKAYLDHLRTKRGKGGKPRVSRKHVVNVQHCLDRIIGECGFERLRDLNRRAVERWADRREADGMGARTLNDHLAALCAFGNWCTESKRIVANPLARPPKRDAKADRRRQRRALTGDEVRRLLRVAQLRPLAEYGRETVQRDDADRPGDRRSRRTWRRAPLTFDGLDAAAERGRLALHKRPDYIIELRRRGRERALVYKTLVLTGLRKGELAALTVGHLELGGPVAFAVLDAADEKAGRGAEIPLRADLVRDLSEWLAAKLEAVRNDARRRVGASVPLRLPPESPLFNVPAGLGRMLDRDLKAAGIPKRDDRGRTVDVHALRHTFGTHLSRGGVAPRTAQAAMRHGSLDLTMNTYTDPRLLDVAGALNVLPELPLDDSPGSERQRATGTDGGGTLLQSSDPLVPMLVPTAGNRCTPGTNADRPAGLVNVLSGKAGIAVSDCADRSKPPLPNAGTGGQAKRVIGFEPTTFTLAT